MKFLLFITLTFGLLQAFGIDYAKAADSVDKDKATGSVDKSKAYEAYQEKDMEKGKKSVDTEII
jgi:hypothetical protein